MIPHAAKLAPGWPLQPTTTAPKAAASAFGAGSGRTVSSKVSATANSDAEGRFIRADFGTLSVVSLYLPSGPGSRNGRRPSSGSWTPFPAAAHQDGEGRVAEVIVCGIGTSRTGNRTLRNWKSNQKNSGFRPRSVPG